MRVRIWIPNSQLSGLDAIGIHNLARELLEVPVRFHVDVSLAQCIQHLNKGLKMWYQPGSEFARLSAQLPYLDLFAGTPVSG